MNRGIKVFRTMYRAKAEPRRIRIHRSLLNQ